jgi:branched-chain amino acid aminotransferase
MGITRDAAIEIARAEGYAVESRSLELADLTGADEAFFTGTAAEITPIRELDGQPIGSGSRGPVTAEVQAKFFDVVNGRDERFAHWLTYLNKAAAA